MGKTFNAVADGYYAAIDWMALHPHWTFWLSVIAIVLMAIA